MPTNCDAYVRKKFTLQNNDLDHLYDLRIGWFHDYEIRLRDGLEGIFGSFLQTLINTIILKTIRRIHNLYIHIIYKGH